MQHIFKSTITKRTDIAPLITEPKDVMATLRYFLLISDIFRTLQSNFAKISNVDWTTKTFDAQSDQFRFIINHNNDLRSVFFLSVTLTQISEYKSAAIPSLLRLQCNKVIITRRWRTDCWKSERSGGDGKVLRDRVGQTAGVPSGAVINEGQRVYHRKGRTPNG